MFPIKSRFFVMLSTVASAFSFFPADGFGEDSPALRRPEYGVSMMGAAPMIDGAVGKGEWIGALQLAPLMDAGTGHPGDYVERVWVGSDAEALYFAFRLERPPGALAPTEADRMEFLFAPEDAGEHFHFDVSGSGVGRGGKREGGSTAFDSAIDWQYQVRPTDDGWEGEMRIPYASLGIAGRGEMEKTKWDFLAHSVRGYPDGYRGVSSFLTGWPSRPNFTKLHFADAGVPAVRVLEAGQLSEGQAGIVAEVSGGDAAGEVEFRALLLRQTGEAVATVEDVNEDEVWVPVVKQLEYFEQLDSGGEDTIRGNFEVVEAWSETVPVAAGGSARVSFQREVDPGEFVWVVRSRKVSDGSVLAAFAFPFEQKSPLSLEVTPFLLTAGGVRADVDYRRIQGLPGDAVLRLELKDSTGEVLSAVEETASPHGTSSILLPLADGFGKVVEAVVSVGSGEAGSAGNFGTASVALELPGKPEWLANGFGEGAGPLPPWPALEVDGNTARVLLREIRFGGNALPESIVSRGEELLAGPVQILAGGEALNWEGSGPIDPSATDAAWEARAGTGDVKATLRSSIEYDGMIRVDLTLEPVGESATLRDWVLSIPYAADQAPAQEDFRKETFEPYHTVSNMETGVQWFCEAPRGWNYGDDGFMALAKKGDALDWTVRFFGKEGAEIDGPLTITFGLMPLPARELDVSYHYDQRRITNMVRDWSAEEATATLCYDSKALMNPDEGTIFCRVSHIENNGVFFRIGGGSDAIAVSVLRLRDEEYKRRLAVFESLPEVEEFALGNPEAVLTDIRNDRTEQSTWKPIALSWRRDGDDVTLTLISVEPFSKVRRSSAVIPVRRWQAAIDGGELCFGGTFDMGIDDVHVSRTALSDGDILALAAGEDLSDEGFTLADGMEETRFSRGLTRTVPRIDASGKGGRAGGLYSGIFVDTVGGVRGNGLLLKAGPRSGIEVMKAYGIRYFFPRFEQFRHLAGAYHFEFMESPVLREEMETFRNAGLETQMYGSFVVNGELEERMRGFAEELFRQPKRPVGDGFLPCMNTPIPDYYVWSWKNLVDYYNVYAGHFDNTIHSWSCDSVEHGCGWYDAEGELQGSVPIFAAREFAKRMRWLFHVHRKETLGEPGVLALHAGARWFTAVADFADLILIGEGWMSSMGGDMFHGVPEENWNRSSGYQKLLGVPIEILTKGKEYPFGPNVLMLYALLNQQTLRMFSHHLEPSYYHIDRERPDGSARAGKVGGEYDPYFNQPGIPNVAAPMALWWQLLDDFDARSATFHPYWSNGALVKLNHADLRSSFYTHDGKDVLLVVSNFSGEPVEAEIELNLAELGLEGRALEVWDAFTDEAYPLENGVIKVSIPVEQYRIVRIETVDGEQ